MPRARATDGARQLLQAGALKCRKTPAEKRLAAHAMRVKFHAAAAARRTTNIKNARFRRYASESFANAAAIGPFFMPKKARLKAQRTPTSSCYILFKPKTFRRRELKHQ